MVTEIKLSALTELATTPAKTDEVYIRDVSEAAAAESKRITVANLIAATRGATLVVAADDSSAKGKAAADYVCDGTADQTDINNAINALPAGGGKVLLLDGIYYVNGSVIIKSNVWLSGCGWATVLKITDGTGGQILMIINGAILENAIVSHLQLDGNLVNATGENFGFMFYPYISRECLVVDCLFTDFREVAVASYPLVSGYHYGNIIARNIIKRSRAEGITLYSSYHCTVTNNTIIDGLGDALSAARDVAIKAGTQGAKTLPHSCKITNNTIVRWRSSGIKVYGDHHTIQNNTIRDCGYGAVGPSATGIDIMPTSHYNTIEGNQVTDNQDTITSVLASNASSGQKVVVVNDGSIFYQDILVTISDDANDELNQIASISGDTLTMYDNLVDTYTTGANAKVTGRRSMLNGIRINAGATLNVVQGNNLYRSTTTSEGSPTALLDNGTNTRKRNNIGNDGSWLSDDDKILVRKTADQTVNNSIALVNDTHLLFPILANEIWEFKLFIIHIGNSTADFKMNMTVPAGATFELRFMGQNSSGGIQELRTAGASDFDCQGSTFNRISVFDGVVVNGGNAGNVQVQWAQDTATVVDTKVLTNSYIVARRIA